MVWFVETFCIRLVQNTWLGITGQNQLVMRLRSRYTLEDGCHCTTIDLSLVHHVTHAYLPTNEHLFEVGWRHWEATRQDTWKRICHDLISWIESKAERCEETLQVRVVRQQTIQPSMFPIQLSQLYEHQTRMKMMATSHIPSQRTTKSTPTMGCT